ncbi:hypothetical protein L218DRAFT_1029301 [Marasmius fiardii PR-910]|nr:hypothetical protein L218DRAFT_1029301 [Marasmius fiardii PR-910]
MATHTTNTSTSHPANSSNRPTVAFGSTAPRTANAPSTSRITGTSQSQTRPSDGSQSNQGEDNTSQRGSNNTIRSKAQRQSSHDSHSGLFGDNDNDNRPPTSSASAEDLLTEANKAAKRQGKKPIPNRPLAASGNPPSDDGNNSHHESSDDSRRAPSSVQSMRTMPSNISRNESIGGLWTISRCFKPQRKLDRAFRLLLGLSTTRQVKRK